MTIKYAPNRVHIDLEVYSEIDLPTRGTYIYANDPSTEIICLYYKINDEPIKGWKFRQGQELPEDLVYALTHPEEYDLVAHNAEFEKVVLSGPAGQAIGIEPEWVKWERWICTRAKAFTYGLPSSLDKCSKALGLADLKDAKGKKLIKLLSMPVAYKKKAYKRTEAENREKVNGEFLYHLDDKDYFYYRVLPEHDPEAYEQFYEYCDQDVAVEYGIDKALWDIRAAERELWIADKYTNELGVKIDVPLVRRVLEYAERFKQELTEEFRHITEINPTQGAAFLKWLKARGHDLPNAQMAVLKEYLANNVDNMAEEVKRAFEVRMLLSKASLSKYQKMLDMADPHDHRLRGCLEYHGAATGRWAARGFQIQNLTKENDNFKQNKIIRDVMQYDYETMLMVYGDLYQAFKCCLRGCIIAEKGHKLAVPDFSQIEARVLPWLAGDNEKLDAFRQIDKDPDAPDIYMIAAAKIYGKEAKDVIKSERQIGKIAELALGYMGGKGAFINFALIYGVEVDEEFAESIKLAWRQANQKVCQLWYELEDKVKKTIVDRKRYRVGEHLQVQRYEDFLLIVLPSGRCLFYYKPNVVKQMMPWGSEKDCIEYWGVKSPSGKPGGKVYGPILTHGGKLTENVTQAAARDALAEPYVKLHNKGFRVPFHVHDEIVCEVPAEEANLKFKEICATMCTNPEWAKGLPLTADGWVDDRYNK